MPGIEYRRNDSKCALCRKDEADEVGSHMAPNFLIHSAFSFDGAGPRDREIVAREHVNNPSRPVYYGRSVSPDAIKADHGRELSDEDVANNINLLVYDHLFCKDCEKRFGILEQEYRQFYAKPSGHISPRIAYLFWLSVFWRMSIGYMAILLGIEDELAIRSILDKAITTKKEIEKSTEDSGDFGYVVWRTKGIKKGYSGIFGTRTLDSPYLIILNDLVVMLISSVHSAGFPLKHGPLEISGDMVSTVDKTIKPIDISLEEFARIRRFVMDQPYADGWGPLYEKALRHFREKDRTSGQPHSDRSEYDALEQCTELDFLSPREPLEFRYLAAMSLAELKYHAAERLGLDYDVLKDQTMFLFPFDIENYKADCRRLINQKGADPYELPCADRFILSKKQMGNKKKIKRHRADVETQLDFFLSLGYTLKDILFDNMRTRGSE